MRSDAAYLGGCVVCAEPEFGLPKSFSSMQHRWARGPLPVAASLSEV